MRDRTTITLRPTTSERALAGRGLAIASARARRGCSWHGQPRASDRDRRSRDRRRRRKNRARRLHRAREPQLRQSLSRLSRRRHRLERQEFAGQGHSSCVPVSLASHYVHRPLGGGDVRRLQRHRAICPGTNCRMNGFDQEHVCATPPKNPQYVYVPHDESRAVLRHGSTNGCSADRMFQSQLDESFVAHQYVIAAQAEWTVDLPSFDVGLRAAARTTRSARSRRSAARTDRPSGPASTTRRSATSSTKPISRGASTRARMGSRSSGGGALWSGYQAIRHIRYGPDWKKTSSRRTGSSSPTCARGSWRTSPGSRRSATTPIT